MTVFHEARSMPGVAEACDAFIKRHSDRWAEVATASECPVFEEVASFEPPVMRFFDTPAECWAIMEPKLETFMASTEGRVSFRDPPEFAEDGGKWRGYCRIYADKRKA